MISRIRSMFQTVGGVSTRGFDAARRDPDWNPAALAITTETAASLPILRAKSRDLIQNNYLAASAIRKLVNGVIGRGIKPQADTAVDGFNELIDRIFKEWAKRCTPEGLSFTGTQKMTLRAALSSGDCFVVKVRPPEDARLRVPLWLRIYEADMVDENLNENLPGGRKIVQGVEFDKYDRAIFYHFHPTHPGDSFGWESRVKTSHIRIPAEDVIHFFERPDGRPSQVRGIPRLTPVINDMRSLGDYKISELMKQKIAACFGLVFTGVEPEAATDGVFCDSNGRPIKKIYPGMIGYGGRGSDVKTVQPPSVVGYPEYTSGHEHAIAAGVGVPYAVLTGDLKRVNLSSSRYGQGMFEREVNSEQDTNTIPSLCETVWSWFITAAFDAGVITVPVVPATWTTTKFPSVNPAQDANARRAALRDGVSTLSDTIAAEGGNARAVFKKRAQENDTLDALGLVFDSDPRHRTLAGVNQPVYDTKTNSGEATDAGSKDKKGGSRRRRNPPSLVRSR